MGKRTILGMAAAVVVTAGMGCGEEAPEVEEISVDSTETLVEPPPKPLPLCHNGMTTGLKTMLPASAFASGIWEKSTCEVNELIDLLNYVCDGSDPDVCKFFNEVAAGHARVQCTRYLDMYGNNRTCADVVDKQPDGSGLGEDAEGDLLNFMMLYTAENPKTPAEAANRLYWDGRLSGGVDTLPPVSLSVAGYYWGKTYSTLQFSTGEPVQSQRRFRALKADPRDCGSCTPYDGPNLDQIAAGSLVMLDTWVPTFTPSSCRFQNNHLVLVPTDPVNPWTVLTGPDCPDEKAYRANGR